MPTSIPKSCPNSTKSHEVYGRLLYLRIKYNKRGTFQPIFPLPSSDNVSIYGSYFQPSFPSVPKEGSTSSLVLTYQGYFSSTFSYWFVFKSSTCKSNASLASLVESLVISIYPLIIGTPFLSKKASTTLATTVIVDSTMAAILMSLCSDSFIEPLST
jgi:hypothetical protein